MIINVAEVCGEDMISREAGKKIRNLILAHWDEPTIELRFDGRLVGSVSFFDEAFGLLMKREGKTVDEMRKKLQFPDLLKEDRLLLNHTVMARIKEQEVLSKAR